MNIHPASPDVTSDDKLWAAIGYPIFPIAILVLLMEDKKARPFIKFNAVQALVFNFVIWVVYGIIAAITFGIGALCFPLFWLVTLWPAYVAYMGNYLELPVISKFIRDQGWGS